MKTIEDKQALLERATKLISRIDESGLKHHVIYTGIGVSPKTFSFFYNLKPEVVTDGMIKRISGFLDDHFKKLSKKN